MNSVTIGDLSTVFRRMSLVNQTKTNLETYSMEIASGRKAELSKSLSGNFTPLASMERTLRTIESYQRGVDDAVFFASSMQNVLGSVAGHVDDAAAPLFNSATYNNSATMEITSTETRATLDSVVYAFNTRAGGRALFSGAATQTTPLQSSETLMAEIQTAIAGATTADEIITAVDAWFAPGSGSYDTAMYKGSASPKSGFVLNDYETASFDITASNQGVRDTLKGLVLGALVSEGALPGDLSEQAKLMQTAGERLYGASGKMQLLSSRVGAQEAKIEAASVRNTAEQYATERAKLEIVSADIYDSAAKLTQAETQLEMMYTITARLSTLKLSDYI
ncbi:flagellin [Celeribacter marinus]|uniref:flagellin n=1 Tax=Celeribacter marinus TaxID=1397108 RepID=UPI003F6AAEBA